MIDLFSQSKENYLPFELPKREGYSSEYSEIEKGFNITVPNGQLFYSERFFNEKLSDRCMEYFLENDSNDWRAADWRELDKEKLSAIKFKNIEWEHDRLLMYGREVYLPRYSAWYGDNNKPYTYSGLTLQPKKWNKGLSYIKEKVSRVAQVEFNSVLMNWYRDGEDYISWHSDAEKELGRNPVIASVNFGEARDFLIRRNDDKAEKLVIPLGHGTLLIMKGELQHYWEHSVPKRTKIEKGRINLTFRVIHT